MISSCILMPCVLRFVSTISGENRCRLLVELQGRLVPQGPGWERADYNVLFKDIDAVCRITG